MSAFKNFHLAFCFQSIGEKEEGKKTKLEAVKSLTIKQLTMRKTKQRKMDKIKFTFHLL